MQPKDPSKPFYEGVWLGANDLEAEGRFIWAATGQHITYSNWDGKNPNNWREEDCVHLLTSNNGRWNDINCDAPVNTNPPAYQITMCERIIVTGRLT